MNVYFKILFLKILCFVCCLFASSMAFTAQNLFVKVEASFRQVKILGFTRAAATMNLATEVAGKVKVVYADIGETILEEGKFACLDDTFVNIDIESAKNDIAQHRADVDYFQKQVTRHKKLVAKKSSAVSMLDDQKRQLANVQGKMKSAELKKQRLEENRQRHCIEVPVGWRVIERNIEPGQWINVGEPVGKVGDYYHLLIPLSLSTKELRSLKERGGELKAYLVDYKQSIKLKIARISPAFDEQSHKIRVDLMVDDNLPDYRGGMRVEILLDVPDEFGAVRIPKQALEERFEEFWLERKNGQRVRVSILGNQNDELVRVMSPDIKVGDEFKVMRP